MSAEAHVFPTRDNLEEELVSLLRQFGSRNHRSRKNQLELLGGDAAPKPNKKKGAIWPPYRGTSTAEQRNLGNLTLVTPFSTGKYSATGHVTTQQMVQRGVSERYAETFAKAFNGSKSLNTWKQRKSILSVIRRCERDSGGVLTLPWESEELQWFVGWCLEEDLKGSTIIQYVSNVRTLHRDLRLEMNNRDWPFISQVIKGHDNLRTKSPGRIPITPELLYHIKAKLSKSHYKVAYRRLIWVVASAMFQGSFRIGELLAPTSTQFCPESTLRNKDVQIKNCVVEGKSVEMLLFNIRSPKECQGKGSVQVEVFDLGRECFFSCVQAWKKWRNSTRLELDPEMPVFRKESGSLLTPAEFNACLKELLADKVTYKDGIVASHSFRAGIASVMARLGYKDSDIKLQGRWSSDSFLKYLKLGRATRLADQYTLASKMSGVVTEVVHHNGQIA